MTETSTGLGAAERALRGAIQMSEVIAKGKLVENLFNHEIQPGDVFIVYRLHQRDLQRQTQGSMLSSRLTFQVARTDGAQPQGNRVVEINGRYTSGTSGHGQIDFQDHSLCIYPDGHILLLTGAAGGRITPLFARDTNTVVYKRPHLPAQTEPPKPHREPTVALPLAAQLKKALVTAAVPDDQDL
jgi:hypothetical protein